MTDLDLIKNIRGLVEGTRWEAVFPSETVFVTAQNKTEARRIAREYGARIIKQQLLSISQIEEGN